nr:hypothetical protein ORM20_00239 [Ochrobactrum phage ORM_20]
MYCFYKNVKELYTLEELCSDCILRCRVLFGDSPVYDAYDCQPVDKEWLRGKIYDWYDAKNAERAAKRRKMWKFRDGPVPLTRGGRKFVNWFRHPHTLQEMKHADEYTRAKRRKLPTSWDDMNRRDGRWNKPVSWKHNRKTQWK